MNKIMHQIKRLSLCLSFLVIGLFMQVQQTFAATSNGSIRFIKESKVSEKKETVKRLYQYLPQTGEQAKQWILVLFGSMLTLFVFLIVVKKYQNNKNLGGKR